MIKINNFLNKKINKILNLPGCYLFKNKYDEIIYIGKSNKLKNRLKQHFVLNKKNNKAKLMLNEITDVDFIFTNNEKESLILEHNLIKKNLPKYNIILSDDRTYPFIFIPKIKNPYYKLIWKKTKIPGIYFGPFPDIYSVKEIFDLLEKLFPLKKCIKIKTNNKPCFFYKLNQCSGACFKNIPDSYYEKKIKMVKDFFNKKTFKIKKIINNKIKILTKTLQFEQAEKWKKLLNKIKNFNIKQDVELKIKINIDFLNFSFNENEIVIIVFSYRNGKFLLKKENRFNLYNNNVEETVLDFLIEFYTYFPSPKTLAIPYNMKSLKILDKLYKIKISLPKKGIKNNILNLIKKNSDIFLKKEILNLKTEKNINNLNDLKKILSLKRIPKEIEFLDLSYIDNNIIVCFIYFLNGIFVSSKTKIYEFKINYKINEKQLFYESVLKHYSNKPLIDLLILDGGILQLKGAKKAILKLNKNIKIIGLVKNIKHKTEYILNDNSIKILLNKNDNLWKFLSNIQDLGHKIVINKLRNKKLNFIKK